MGGAGAWAPRSRGSPCANGRVVTPVPRVCPSQRGLVVSKVRRLGSHVGCAREVGAVPFCSRKGWERFARGSWASSQPRAVLYGGVGPQAALAFVIGEWRARWLRVVRSAWPSGSPGGGSLFVAGAPSGWRLRGAQGWFTSASPAGCGGCGVSFRARGRLDPRITPQAAVPPVPGTAGTGSRTFDSSSSAGDSSTESEYHPRH